jgi:hypothetical protein
MSERKSNVKLGKTIAVGLIVAMVATAVLLPGRQTIPVLNQLTALVTGAEHTAITGSL